MPTCALELFLCLLWHHPLWLSPPPCSPPTPAITPPYCSLLTLFCSPCKSLCSPEVHPQLLFFFQFAYIHAGDFRWVHSLNYCPGLFLSSAPLLYPYAPRTHLQDINQYDVGHIMDAHLVPSVLTEEWMNECIWCTERSSEGWVSKEEPGLHSAFQ